MRSLNSICRAREEARYISRSWSNPSKAVEPVSAVSKIMPDADQTYGSQANKDLWYQLEVRRIDNGSKLFTPDIVAEANRGFARANNTLGTPYFVYQFSLFSNPEFLLEYIDRNLFTVEYKGVQI
jgi:hypothetical protein